MILAHPLVVLHNVTNVGSGYLVDLGYLIFWKFRFQDFDEIYVRTFCGLASYLFLKSGNLGRELGLFFGGFRILGCEGFGLVLFHCLPHLCGSGSNDFVALCR